MATHFRRLVFHLVPCYHKLLPLPSLRFLENQQAVNKGFETMLMKRSRSIQKDQNMAAASKTNHNCFEPFSKNRHNNNSVFTVAGLFLGQGPKTLSDCDFVMSPTSPLDFIKFSSAFRTRKSWDDQSSKVGLSLVDSLDNNSLLGGKNPHKLGLEGKNIVFGPRLRIKSLSLGSKFDDHLLSPPSKIKFSGISMFEIADPLEPEHGREFRSCSSGSRLPFAGKLTGVSHLLASRDFLSLCYSCSKKLAGEDIYIYKGEKAFCSPSCRELEMVEYEEIEESHNDTPEIHDPDDQEPE